MPAPLLKLPDEVTGYSLGLAHNNYAIVVPEETINMIVNPSFENASDWAYGWGYTGTTNWQSSIDHASRGRACAYQSQNNGSIYTNPAMTLISGIPYTFACDVQGRAGGTVTLTAELAGQPTRTATYKYTGRWQRVVLSFVTSAGGDWTFRIATNAPVYVDGAQLEAKMYATTYCDGDVMGYGLVPNEYRWAGKEHASPSYRSHMTRHGGRLTPIGIAEKVHIVSVQGLGAAPVQMTTNQLYDGTAYVSQAQDRPREVTIIFALYGDSPRDLRSVRKQLIDLFALSPSHQVQPVRIVIYPNNANDDPDGQPLILTCHYVDGLEGMRTSYYSERVAIRLQSVTAYLEEFYYGVVPFSPLPTPAAVGQVMYRSPDGEWDRVTPNATSFEVFSGQVPTGSVNAVAFLGEKLVFGGKFVNLEGNAALDYLVAYDPLATPTPTKSIVGDGVNNAVFGLARGEKSHFGKLFISGDFTANAAGSRTARRYAVHPGGDISTPLTFPAVGLASGSINCFAFHRNGRIYVGGDFPQLSNGVNVPSLAYIDPTTLNLGALNLVSSMSGGFWFSAVAGLDDFIYFGGMNGTIVDGVSIGPVISYHPPSGTIRPLGQRLNGSLVYGLTIGPDGYLYAAGRTFTRAGTWASTQTTNYMARYNGFDWEVLNPISGGTPGGFGYAELEGATGITGVDTTLYVTGGFRNPSYGYARFMGNKMLPGDITLPNYGVGGIASSYEGALGMYLYAGNPTDGAHPWVKPSSMTAYSPATETVTVEEESEWDLYVVGPCVLTSLSNMTTNSHLFFASFVVQAGEYVRISLHGNKIEARTSLGVLIPSNYLTYSDAPARMALMPGDNEIQLAMSSYNTSGTKITMGIRRKVRSFDYAE